MTPLYLVSGVDGGAAVGQHAGHVQLCHEHGLVQRRRRVAARALSKVKARAEGCEGCRNREREKGACGVAEFW